jgi:CRISPR-associated endonuclease/helicase Cas3
VSYLTLAQAGCGSGKSLAAYLWGLKWCKLAEAEGRRNLRFFFCLPTTGTTTEHFKDYALESGIETSLTHSRSVVDLRTMAETTADEEATTVQEEASEAAKNNLQVMQDKIQALALWSTPLTVTTADTVLGLMVNARKSIYSLPAIMNSVVVFDEIHAFDEHLFGHLLAFLKHFPNIPILLMTASLPEDRKRALTIIRPDLQSLSGPPAFELLERYEIRREIKSEQVLDCIGKCLESDGKVLWVRNRVDWANKAYADCHQRFSTLASVDIYHSRFRYGDRADRHRRVIDRFRHGKRGCVLVATQVAEMSLDLSADLLITDLAPIPALIQRMGRLNRYSTPESPGIPREALIIPFPSLIKNGALPYKESELETTKDWLCQLRKMNRALCQRDLAEVFEQVAALKEIDLTKTDDQAIFFSGLWQTRPGLTRDQSYTMSVILQKDRDKCSELNSVGEPTQDWLKRHEVSVPIRDSMLRWPRIGYLPVAPHNEIHYDYDEQTKEGTGALWL